MRLLALACLLLFLLAGPVLAITTPPFLNTITLSAPFGGYLVVNASRTYLLLRIGPDDGLDYAPVACSPGDPTGCDLLNAGDFVQVRGTLERMSEAHATCGDTPPVDIVAYSRIIPLTVWKCVGKVCTDMAPSSTK